MQENIRLMMWTIISLAGLWFITMTVNRNVFMHTDRQLIGTVPFVQTDIGTQCGSNVNPQQYVEYKLNTKSQIVFLCPQTYWPIQKQVVANTLSTGLRQLIGPTANIGLLYPVTSTTTTAPASSSAPVANASPEPAVPAATPALSPTLDSTMVAPKLDTSGINTPQAAAPKQPTAPAPAANPFIGAPASAPAPAAPSSAPVPAQ